MRMPDELPKRPARQSCDWTMRQIGADPVRSRNKLQHWSAKGGALDEAAGLGQPIRHANGGNGRAGRAARPDEKPSRPAPAAICKPAATGAMPYAMAAI